MCSSRNSVTDTLYSNNIFVVAFFTTSFLENKNASGQGKGSISKKIIVCCTIIYANIADAQEKKKETENKVSPPKGETECKEPASNCLCLTVCLSVCPSVSCPVTKSSSLLYTHTQTDAQSNWNLS